MKRSAFTLVELMVVLAIVALLSALIFGAISSVREGNKRGSCQGNLNQLYAAARLYAQDNDGQFPYLKTSTAPTDAKAGGIGLWSLYVYSVGGSLPYAASDANQPAVLASYLKAPRAFHCPSDNGIGKTGIPNGDLEYVDGSGNRLINPDYLSYQTKDPDMAVTANLPTYSTYRATGVKREMRDYDNPADTSKRSPDQTIFTWCRFHRSTTNDEKDVKSPDKTFDNVMFLDGSVQSVPVSQTVIGVNAAGAATGTYACRAWGRVPLSEANATPDVPGSSLKNTTVCQPIS